MKDANENASFPDAANDPQFQVKEPLIKKNYASLVKGAVLSMGKIFRMLTASIQDNQHKRGSSRKKTGDLHQRGRYNRVIRKRRRATQIAHASRKFNQIKAKAA